MRPVRVLVLLAVLAVLGVRDAAAQASGAPVLYWIDTNFGAPTLNDADASGTPIASVPLAAGSLPEGLAIDLSGRPHWAEAAWIGARVMRAAPNLHSITALVTGGSALRGIAVDDVAHQLYWTSSNLASGAKLYRSAIDGTGAAMFIALPVGANPRGIAVDHAGGKVYWADFDLDAIFRVNLNGTVLENWMPLPAQSHPYGIAFDPMHAQVYWTEYAGKIRRAPTTGGSAATLVGGLPNPTYLALDPATGRMYWSEGGAGAQHIERADLSGANRVTLPLPLTTYGGLAYQSSYGVATPPADLPSEFAFAPIVPNPARGDVRLLYALPHSSDVRLSVLDLQGREIAVLVNGPVAAGRWVATWATGRGRAPGVYFARFASDGRAWVRRVVVTR